ncbi:hypothetical protein FJT64_016573 [Amphibalanus amphitrite]|uniref:Reverse transcriptase domain-containing protein n=1 Tax=Amphibalanus amphitrite TaxID=1232801 RepID=A0A6A4XEA4_AMPAM|nr:hypothetical protein FJT64_016573 [Amphibalanus amphitrite]
MSGDEFQCTGSGSADVVTVTGQRARVSVLVVSERPLGVELIIGMSGISSLGGVSVQSPSQVRFCGAAARAPLEVDAPDFSVRFDSAERKWTVAWKWADNSGPECLENSVPQYSVPRSARYEFDTELDTWISNGWLLPYDEQRLGPPRGLVPLMAVQQKNKEKVRPVLDYRELNSHLNAHTAEADVCADQLRKWRRHGRNVAVVDLKKAYLQIHLDESLWPYQTVEIRGQRFYLGRLGFGLSLGPLVMKAVVSAVLAQDPEIQRAVLSYVDDLLVDEDIASAERVVSHFASGPYALQAQVDHVAERVNSDDPAHGVWCVSVGTAVAADTGAAVGTAVAADTGAAVGTAVAADTGAAVGTAVAADTGAAVGTAVAADTGAAVGTAVAADTEAAVGTAVAADTGATAVVGAAVAAGTEAAVATGATVDASIAQLHERAGHPGIRRTWYFARRDIAPTITRSQ